VNIYSDIKIVPCRSTHLRGLKLDSHLWELQVYPKAEANIRSKEREIDILISIIIKFLL